VKDTEIERVDAAKAPETEIAGPTQSKSVEHFQPAAELSAAQVRLGSASDIEFRPHHFSYQRVA
jgi:hypothetical protein